MPYRETGFDAISMRGVANAWIRDIQIEDMDYGIQVGSDGSLSHGKLEHVFRSRKVAGLTPTVRSPI
jgi:hypothetical protein